MGEISQAMNPTSPLDHPRFDVVDIMFLRPLQALFERLVARVEGIRMETNSDCIFHILFVSKLLSRRPQQTPADQLRHIRHFHRLGIVAERGVEDPPFAILQTEGHRLVFLNDF